MGRPARQYSWAPFGKGHTLALVHGADSPRTITALADALAAAVVEHFPHLELYPFAVSDFAHPAARAAILRGELDLLESPMSRPDLLKEVRADERRAAEAAKALGLDPTSHARLVRDRAEAGLSIDELERRQKQQLEHGQQLRLEAEARLQLDEVHVVDVEPTEPEPA